MQYWDSCIWVTGKVFNNSTYRLTAVNANNSTSLSFAFDQYISKNTPLSILMLTVLIRSIKSNFSYERPLADSVNQFCDRPFMQMNMLGMQTDPHMNMCCRIGDQ